MTRRRCSAIVGSNWSCQIERLQRCQNQALADVDGISLCGTHINAVAERPQLVVTMLEPTPQVRLPSTEEKAAQGKRCPCRGSDDYCICQNIADPPSPDPEDLCRCGDARRQHLHGTGRCNLGSLCTPYPCQRFRLFRPATPATAADQAQPVAEG